MDESEEKTNSTRKSLVSAIALIAVLMLLMYAAPVLLEKLQQWQSREDTGAVAEPEKTAHTPEVPGQLAGWLPQVQSQLPKNQDGTGIYRLRHMRQNTDGSELLLDLQKTTGEPPFDLILKRDRFGRYISEDEKIPMKLYPK